jgi:hypothetical protein
MTVIELLVFCAWVGVGVLVAGFAGAQWGTAGYLIGFPVGMGATWVVGFLAIRIASRRDFAKIQKTIDPIIQSDPAFSTLAIRQDDGWAFLDGQVETADDLQRLREILTLTVGERKADNLLILVKVAATEQDQ